MFETKKLERKVEKLEERIHSLEEQPALDFSLLLPLIITLFSSTPSTSSDMIQLKCNVQDLDKRLFLLENKSKCKKCE